MIDRFLKFVQEREAIRIKREHGYPAPWTSDPILSKYRFCNIRRRDDRVSKWIQSAIAWDAEAEHLGPWLALARYVNWPPTLQMLLDEGIVPTGKINWRQAGKLIDGRSASGEKTWTGAYMVRAERMPDGKKGAYVAETVLKGMFESKVKRRELATALREGRRQAVHSVLRGGYGWGSFMAGQVIDDWTWTYLLREPIDNYSWAPQGPGSIRGLCRLEQKGLNGSYAEGEWQTKLMSIRGEIIRGLGSLHNDMTLMDIQNCLCEFDKYERARLGQGRPRSQYRPETAY